MAKRRSADRALDDSESWGDAAIDQHLVWRRNLLFHLFGIAGLALIALLPGAEGSHVEVALFIAGVGIPYSLGLSWWYHRTGRLLPIMPFADALLPCVVLWMAPELLAPVLVVMLAAIAIAATAFGARLAILAALVGTLAVLAVLARSEMDTWAVSVITYGLIAGAVAFALGTMSEAERDLRRRHTELTSGIDAIVWEQVSQRPSRLWVNQRAVDLFGYPTDSWLEPGFWRAHVHPDDREEARARYREAIWRGQNLELDYRMLAADGSVVHVQDRMRVELDDTGQPVHVRGVMIDVTGEREAQAQRRQYLDLVDNLALALVVLRLGREGDDRPDDLGFEVAVMNPGAGELFGRVPDEAVGLAFVELGLPDTEALEDRLQRVLETGERVELDEVRFGEGRGGRVYSLAAFALSGDAVGLSLQDVTERAMAADVLRRQALHDGLTGLPNRLRLSERMREAIEAAPEGAHVALLLMDLDHFKDVNDALGHDQGDRLLVEVSRRLQRVVRRADTIARLGGDEFAVLLTGEQAEQAETIATYVRDALEQPFRLGGISVQTNASIGIARFPEHGTEGETLAQRADVAMYAAKRSKSPFSIYDPELDQSSVRRLALLGELRRAIEEDELVLHFQPTLDLRSGTIVGCEALVRWQHPEHGLMPPGEFIELAEVSGLIQPLSRWVVDHVLGQIARWGERGWELTVSANLSVRNLYDRELVSWLTQRIEHHGVPAARLKIEVTESELMDDPMLAMEVLRQLTELGTTTSIDDFGTGYSSLAYLKHLSIDELKIDRSFVAAMTKDDSDLTIVRSTIDLSHNLGLSVVAEGVEDGPTLAHLATLGCDRIQGYFLSRPVPAPELEALIEDGSRVAEVAAFIDDDS